MKWLFPLRLTRQDGQTVLLVARAVDQAGNVGPSTGPMEIVLDNQGPSLSGGQVNGTLAGTVRDGSGVASLTVSLDGGAHYEPAVLTGETWSYDLSAWTGSPRQPFALLRAADTWGNVTRALVPVESSSRQRIYLPLITRMR